MWLWTSPSPDGEKLVAACRSLETRRGGGVVWRRLGREGAVRSEHRRRVRARRSRSVLPDGELLATGGGGSGEIELCCGTRERGSDGRTLRALTGWVLGLEFDRTGERLVSSGNGWLDTSVGCREARTFGSPLPGHRQRLGYLVADVTADGDSTRGRLAAGIGGVCGMTTTRRGRSRACRSSRGAR